MSQAKVRPVNSIHRQRHLLHSVNHTVLHIYSNTIKHKPNLVYMYSPIKNPKISNKFPSTAQTHYFTPTRTNARSQVTSFRLPPYNPRAALRKAEVR